MLKITDWTLEAGGHRIDREPWKTLGTLTLVIAISAVLTGLLFVSPLLAIAHAVLRYTRRRGFAWRDADGRVHLDISAGSLTRRPS